MVPPLVLPAHVVPNLISLQGIHVIFVVLVISVQMEVHANNALNIPILMLVDHAFVLLVLLVLNKLPREQPLVVNVVSVNTQQEEVHVKTVLPELSLTSLVVMSAYLVLVVLHLLLGLVFAL